MSHKNVIIIDDELLIRDLLYDFFMEKGWQVSVADSGDKGLEILKSRVFDLALIDLKMPGIEGMSLIQKVKDFFPSLPVVIITAFPTYESAVEALRLKVSDYITKPFNVNKLYKTVCGIIENNKEYSQEVPTNNY